MDTTTNVGLGRLHNIMGNNDSNDDYLSELTIDRSTADEKYSMHSNNNNTIDGDSVNLKEEGMMWFFVFVVVSVFVVCIWYVPMCAAENPIENSGLTHIQFDFQLCYVQPDRGSDEKRGNQWTNCSAHVIKGEKEISGECIENRGG